MPYLVRPGVPSDVEELCKVYFSAFAGGFLSDQVFPESSEEAWDFWRKSLAAEIGSPGAHFLVVLDSDSSKPQRLIAFAKWNEPIYPHMVVPAPPPSLPWPSGADTALADSFFGALDQKHQDIMGKTPHWHLEIIAVRKEYQGKGAGGHLMKWGLEKADRDGVEAYLESSTNAIPVYERYGFTAIETLRFADGKLTEVLMVRKSSPKGASEV